MTSVVGSEVRPYLLGGEARHAAGERLAVTFPYDGRVVAEVTLADEEAIERALALATAAREATAAIPPHERASCPQRGGRARRGTAGRARPADDARDRQRDLGDTRRGATDDRDPPERSRGGEACDRRGDPDRRVAERDGTAGAHAAVPGRPGARDHPVQRSAPARRSQAAPRPTRPAIRASCDPRGRRRSRRCRSAS